MAGRRMQQLDPPDSQTARASHRRGPLLAAAFTIGAVLLLGFIFAYWSSLLDVDHPGSSLSAFLFPSVSDLATGQRTVWVAMNEAALSPSPEGGRISVKVSDDDGLHLTLRSPDGDEAVVPHEVTSYDGSTSVYWDNEVALDTSGCPPTGGCLLRYELIVHERPADTARVTIDARLEYEVGDDTVPDGASLELALEAPAGGAWITSVGDRWAIEDGGSFLVDRGERAEKTFRLDAPRSEVPPGAVELDGSLTAIWEGRLDVVTPNGAVVLEATEGSGATVPLVPADVDPQRGTTQLSLPLPVEFACDRSNCTATVTVALTLRRGDWAVAGWAIGGRLETVDGRSIPGWTMD